MATYSFFQSAQGDPTRSKRRMGRQTADGLPFSTTATWVDFYHYGGAGNLTPNKLERQAITSGSQLRASILSKTDVNLTYNMGDLDAGSTAQAMLWYSFLQGYANVATLSGAAKRHQIGGGLTANTMSQKLSVCHDNDDGMPFRVADVIPSGFTLSLVPRQNATLVFNCVGGKYDYWEDAVRSSGSGALLPVLRHTTNLMTSGGPNWSSATGASAQDVYLEVQTDTAALVNFKAKLTSGGTYGASQQATRGVWYYMLADAAGTDAVLGARPEQVQVYWPTGVDDTFPNADAYKVAQRRTVWTPTFQTEVLVPEVTCRFYLDVNKDGTAEEFVVDGGVTITGTRETTETRYTTGGVQPSGTFRAGFRRYEIALNRRFVDLDLQQALLSNASVAILIEGLTDTAIGATAYEYGYSFCMPNCSLVGSTFDVGDGGSNRDETLTLLARAPASTYTTPAIQGATVGVASDFEVIFDTALTSAP